jgi:hypothetical protein
MATTWDELLTLRGPALDRRMRSGGPVDPEALKNRRYDGVSLNLPRLVERLTWVKFTKVFRAEPDGTLRGWNCRTVQSPLDAPFRLERRGGAPVTYGHYVVRDPAGYRLPRPYDAGVLLDYGLGGNGRLDPTARVRDPLVSLDGGASEILLGWSYLDLGVARVPTPSYFALRRGAPLEHDARPR